MSSKSHSRRSRLCAGRCSYWQVAIETLHVIFTPQALPVWQSVLLLQPHDAPPTQTGPGLHDTVQSEQ